MIQNEPAPFDTEAINTRNKVIWLQEQKLFPFGPAKDRPMVQDKSL